MGRLKNGCGDALSAECSFKTCEKAMTARNRLSTASIFLASNRRRQASSRASIRAVRTVLASSANRGFATDAMLATGSTAESSTSPGRNSVTIIAGRQRSDLIFLLQRPPGEVRSAGAEDGVSPEANAELATHRGCDVDCGEYAETFIGKRGLSSDR